MTSLVTGGGGFIGSNLVRALLERGTTSASSTTFPLSMGILAGLEKEVEVVEGELRSYERVHAQNAAASLFSISVLGPCAVGKDLLTTSAVNVEGTMNVPLAARDEGMRRVVFASSSSVYGNALSCRYASRWRPTLSPCTASRSSRRSVTAWCPAASTTRSTVVPRHFNVFRAATGPDVAVCRRRAASSPRSRRVGP